jgi:hypothetical protein
MSSLYSGRFAISYEIMETDQPCPHAMRREVLRRKVRRLFLLEAKRSKNKEKRVFFY